jgi:hypothetical protein
MIRRPVGKIKPMSNSFPAPLFCPVIDQVGEMFVIEGACTCCDKNIYLPMFMTENVTGINVRFEHNSLLDAPLKQSKQTCLDCDQELIQLYICAGDTKLLLE